MTCLVWADFSAEAPHSSQVGCVCCWSPKLGFRYLGLYAEAREVGGSSWGGSWLAGSPRATQTLPGAEVLDGGLEAKTAMSRIEERSSRRFRGIQGSESGQRLCSHSTDLMESGIVVGLAALRPGFLPRAAASPRRSGFRGYIWGQEGVRRMAAWRLTGTGARRHGTGLHRPSQQGQDAGWGGVPGAPRPDLVAGGRRAVPGFLLQCGWRRRGLPLLWKSCLPLPSVLAELVSSSSFFLKMTFYVFNSRCVEHGYAQVGGSL